MKKYFLKISNYVNEKIAELPSDEKEDLEEYMLDKLEDWLIKNENKEIFKLFD